MQANSEVRSTSPKVLAFPGQMARTAPSQSQPDPAPQIEGAPATKYDPRKHGTWAQWATALMALLAFGLAMQNRSLTKLYHDEANQSRATDEHVGKLIDDKLNPAQIATNQRLDKIDERLGRLGQQLGQLQGTLGIYTAGQDALKSRLDQQIALANMTDPKRVDRAVAVIRTEIDKARSTKQPAPVAEYRAALRAFPDTAIGYWKTVADIINYQSSLDQKIGLAPNPRSVARPCPGLTADAGNGHNSYENVTIQNCIVDLDTTHNLLENVIIRNSVIRYHGGSVAIRNVALMNCYFEVDLTQPPNPSQKELLRAILDSAEQKTVVLQHIKPAPG